MSKKQIPEQTIPTERRIGDFQVSENDSLLFSFKLLEQNEYFGFGGICDRWSVDLFELLKNISDIPISELVNGRRGTYRFHRHDNATPPCILPHNIPLKESYQIRVSKSKGGIHGVLVDDVFYVFWLDPLHNMYPNEHYGGVRKLKKLKECCLLMREDNDLLSKENEKLKDENKALKEDNDTYAELLNSVESGKGSLNGK